MANRFGCLRVGSRGAHCAVWYEEEHTCCYCGVRTGSGPEELDWSGLRDDDTSEPLGHDEGGEA